MVVVAIGLTEAELLEHIRKYYSDAAAERTYNLLRITGHMPPERSVDNA